MGAEPAKESCPPSSVRMELSESEAAPSSLPPLSSRWRPWVRHPTFPLIVLVLLTQIFRDEFPFSHYPMYSKPTSRPLKWQYMADGDGKPWQPGRLVPRSAC